MPRLWTRERADDRDVPLQAVAEGGGNVVRYGKRKSAELSHAERIPRNFKSDGNDAWFYAGRGTFYFLSTFSDGPRTIVVPTKMLKMAFRECGIKP